MVAITGGVPSAGPTSRWLVGTRPIDLRSGPPVSHLSDNEVLVADALMTCMGQWGLAKTTMDDIARVSGLSRATVYRLFPGGKTAILDAAAQAEVRALVGLLVDEFARAADLEDCLVAATHAAATFLDGHEALVFMRDHEPVALERLLSFDRLDLLFATAGELLALGLAPLLDDDVDRARVIGVWLTRLVVSYLASPSPWFDLTDRDDVVRMIRTFVMPGVECCVPVGQS